jgi:hypothetical protein
MKIYKVPVTFEVFLTEREVSDLQKAAKQKLLDLIDVDGPENVLDLGFFGKPQELDTEEQKDFVQASKEAYQTQLMAIANGLTHDPNITAKQAQAALRRMF